MEVALANARTRGFTNSFSAYISWLIERDTTGHVVREEIGTYAHAPRAQPAAKKKLKPAAKLSTRARKTNAG